jgi:sugar lactone lactonase YvrE
LLSTYRGRLTEGVTYNASNNTLLWVDIIAAEVHRVSLDNVSEATHERVTFALLSPSESIGAIGLTKDDNKVIACCKFGVAVADFQTKSISYILRYPHDHTDLRSNDGIIDRWGNLWIGTMSDFFVGSVEPKGRLYHVSCKDLKVTTMIEGCYIPNGLSFSEDGTKFFWTDSKTYQIWRFDYNHELNKLSNRTSHINTKQFSTLSQEESPEPDGYAMTKNEEIFAAIFSASRVLQFDKCGMTIEQEFKLPTRNVTCCTLGGRGNNVLFITTAQLQHLNASECASADNKEGDLGGFLFAVELDKAIVGQNEHFWGGAIA